MCDNPMSHIHTHTHTLFSSLIHGKGNHVQSMFISIESVTIPPWEDKAPSTLSCAQFSQFAVPKLCAENAFSSRQKSNTFVFWWSSIHTYRVMCSESFASTRSFSFFIITWELTICPLPITYTFKINNLCRNIFSITLAPTIMILFIAIISLRVNVHIFNWKECRQVWLEGIALNFNRDIPKHMKYYSLSVKLKILSFITYLCQKV